MNKSIISTTIGVIMLSACGSRIDKMSESALFMELPDYCPTPDGMAIDRNGNLVLACPNFADTTKPAVLMRITPDGQLSKWIDVPVLAATGVAAPMGIDFNEKGELYVCDNQGWSGSETGKNKGRLLKLIFDGNGNLTDTIVIALGMEHPNGVRVHNGYVYVTQSILTPLSTNKTVSGVYRFLEDDKNIAVTNSKKDPNLLFTVETGNDEVRYGLDGLDFDSAGNLYAGNFGDASIIKVVFDENDNVSDISVWAQNPEQMKSVDGICFDRNSGNMYVADFSANAIARITPDGKIKRIAQSPDCTGKDGGLDQPGEPIVWQGKLIVSCFDAVTGPDKVNTSHDKPYTLAQIEIEDK